MIKKIRILIVILVLATALFSKVSAQYYNTGFGGRIGSYTGVTGKFFLNEVNAIEGMVSFPWNNIVLAHVLYEFQKPIRDIEYLSWYIGGGGHVGGNNGATILGLDFIIGTEYTFKELPFCIGLDWKPEINIVGDQNFWGDKVALTLKYVF